MTEAGGPSAADVPVTLTTLRVLSSRTRFELLRRLAVRRMTVSELAKTSGLGKSTVHTHLRPLVASGFVDRHEDDRLWVYYSLTPLGRRLVQAARPRLVIVGALGLAGLATGLLLLWLALARWAGLVGPAPPTGDLRAPAPDPLGWLLAAAALVLTAGVVLLALAWRLAGRMLDAPPRDAPS